MDIVMTPGATAAANTQAQVEAEALKTAEKNEEINAQGQQQQQQPKVESPQVELKLPDGPLSKADIDAVADEFIAQGKLSDKTYAVLEKRGLSRDLIDGYIEGVKAQTELMCSRVLAPVGGQEGYEKLIKWAAQNLSDEAKAEFDGIMTAMKSEADMTEAVKKLQRTYEQAVGKTPSSPLFGNEGNSGVTPFQSIEEMAEAMNDPRYTGIGGLRDPAYVKSVYDRASRMK